MVSSWIGSFVERMEWYDVALTKWSAMFFTLFVLTVWPDAQAFLLGIAWYWYLALCLLFAAPVTVKIFRSST